MSIYSAEIYVSMDLDFVITGYQKRSKIEGVMQDIGFHQAGISNILKPDCWLSFQADPYRLANSKYPKLKCWSTKQASCALSLLRIVLRTV